MRHPGGPIYIESEPQTRWGSREPYYPPLPAIPERMGHTWDDSLRCHKCARTMAKQAKEPRRCPGRLVHRDRCPNGDPQQPPATSVLRCVTCQRIRQREYRARKKAMGAA